MNDRSVLIFLVLVLITVIFFNYVGIQQLIELETSNEINSDPNKAISRRSNQFRLTTTDTSTAILKSDTRYRIITNYVTGTYKAEYNDSLVTFATHGDFRYLDNLVGIVERWRAPISVAIFAPGKDLEATLERILYLRQCETPLIKKWVGFHILTLENINTDIMISSERSKRDAVAGINF